MTSLIAMRMGTMRRGRRIFESPLNEYELGAGSSAVLQYGFYFLFLFAPPLVVLLEFLRIYSVGILGILNLSREFHKRGYSRLESLTLI